MQNWDSGNLNSSPKALLYGRTVMCLLKCISPLAYYDAKLYNINKYFKDIKINMFWF